MNIIETEFADLYIIDPLVHKDKRGYFFESYRDDIFKEKIGNINFVQENESYSKKGTLRGLHFQTEPHSQSKLVRCVKGKVLDVVVDLRKKSKTFGKHFKIELTEKNGKSIFIPPGFAHGFLAREKENIVHYYNTNFRSSKHEIGIIWNDPSLKIKWPIKKPILSKKDKKNLTFKQFQKK